MAIIKRQLLCTWLLWICLLTAPFGVRTTPSCPEGCVCRVRRYQGLMTNCSGLGRQHVTAHLAQISISTRFLYLEDNNMTSLDGGIFDSITRLQYLSVKYNRLHDLFDIASQLTRKTTNNLLTLALSANGITDIPTEGFLFFNKLQSLYLDGNLIRDLHADNFEYVPHLLTLDLSNNRLQRIGSEALRWLSSLTDLQLSDNQLAAIEDGAFIDLRDLRNLNLANNKLSAALRLSTLQGLDSLQMLNLNKNWLIGLPSSVFVPVPGLLQLAMKGNRLRHIPISALRNCPRLRNLYLDDNRIEHLPPELNLLKSLKSLYLSHNNIRAIHQHSFVGLMELEALWLNYNSINTLPEDLLDRFVQMEYGALKFENNPFICDCHLVWLARWMRHQTIPEYIKEHPTCSSPGHFVGLPLTQVPLDKMTCDYDPEECVAVDHVTSNCVDLKLRMCSQRGESMLKSCVCSTWMSRSCHVCPSGSYGAHSHSGGQACHSCPAFSTSLYGSKQLSDCRCLAGYTGKNGHPCSACAEGYYKAGTGPGECLPCAPGSVTYYEASPHCECQPGYYLHDDGSCKACEVNTYKEHAGPLPCRPCTDHSQGPVGSNSSTLCVCKYGQYKHITNRKFGMCQEYLNQEEIGMGLVSPPPGFKTILASENMLDNIKNKEDGSHQTIWPIIGAILGVIGSIISVVAVVIFVYIYKKRDKSVTVVTSQSQEMEPVSTDLYRVQSMVNMYVSNQLYAQYEFPKKQLSVGPLIGLGAFGQVHEALAYGLYQDDSKPTKVALKSLKENATPEEVEALKTELNQMLYVGKHPNIISLIGACTQKGQLTIIMEHAKHGNLLNYLKARSSTSEENYSARDPATKSRTKREHKHKNREMKNITEDKEMMTFVWQIAKGMDHLSNMKCIHRDLAARNVLLSCGPNCSIVAKVSDFGLAREVYESGYYFKNSKGRLPFKWMSPEALLCGHYTTKSDVWSYGILLWEVATSGSTPYPGIPVEQMYDMLKAGYRMKRPHLCPNKLYEIMLHCWHESPADRPTFRELVDKFDKIVQEAARKEYIEIEADQSMELFPGTPARSMEGHRLLNDFDEKGVTSSEQYTQGLHRGNPLDLPLVSVASSEGMNTIWPPEMKSELPLGEGMSPSNTPALIQFELITIESDLHNSEMGTMKSGEVHCISNINKFNEDGQELCDEKTFHTHERMHLLDPEGSVKVPRRATSIPNVYTSTTNKA